CHQLVAAGLVGLMHRRTSCAEARGYDPARFVLQARRMVRSVCYGLVCALLVAGCTDEPRVDDDGETPQAELPDDFDATTATPPVDDGWVPPAFTATRFGVFYQ